jgi:NodT family efflux transporter outer membrane factor (OMF) lipoprotein
MKFRRNSTVLSHFTRGIRRPIAAIAAAGIFLGGCAVGPKYVAPTNHLEPFHNSVPLAADSAKASQLDTWWTGFDDPMLVTIIERALNQNLDLAAAIARVQQARAVAKAVGAQLLPTVDLNASVAAERLSAAGPFGSLATSVPGYARDYQEYTLGTAASWEIDVAGGLRRGAAAARDEFQEAQALHAGTRVSIAAESADTYLQVRGAQARLAVASEMIETDSRLLSLIQVRFNAGEGTGREVAQAEALLLDAKTTVPTLQIELEAQLNRLDVLMGVQPGTYAAELSKPGKIPSIPAIQPTQPVEMLRRRPDIIAAERQLAASNERIGVAISDYYPKVSLSGVLGLDTISASNFFTEKAFQPAAVGGLRWRLFDFGKINAEVAQARGGYAESLADYRLAVLKATEDVENALITLSQTQVRLQHLQDEVAALTRARDLSQQAYEAGAIPLTDVLDADRQLLVARDALETTRADAARAAVRTFRSFGAGWDSGSIRGI